MWVLALGKKLKVVSRRGQVEPIIRNISAVVYKENTRKKPENLKLFITIIILLLHSLPQ